MARYKYISCHPISRVQLHPNLRLDRPRWSWTVGGGGTLTAHITVPEDSVQIELLRAATEPKQAAIYVRDSANQYPWGGVIVERDWDPVAGSITINVIEWRSWFDKVIAGPMLDMSSDILYSWVNIDQLVIANALAVIAADLGATDGSAPVIMANPTPSSGKMRDLNFYGTQLKRPGQLIDSIANRDGGFEWTLEVRPHTSDGLPQLYFRTYFPERGSVIPGLVFRRTSKGGNLTAYGPIKQSAVDRVERFWATGVGQPPDQIFAQDTDPQLVNGQILRFESGTNYNTVSVRTTLAAHARAARRFYAPGVNLVSVELPLSSPDVDSYGIGDRGRLIIQDRWLDIDLEAVRVIEKVVDMAGAGKVGLTLDLTDFTLPEVDSGGGV